MVRRGFLEGDPHELRLIEQIKKGDRNAFESLIGKYSAPLWNYVTFRVRDEADAKDVIQETMLAVWQGLAGYEAQSSFKTWAFGVARKKLADFYRRRAGRGTLPLEDYEGEYAPDDDFERSVEKLDVDRARTRLSERDNELVYLVFQAQLSYPQVAETLGIPVGTVKSRMSGIKSRLRGLLAGEG